MNGYAFCLCHYKEYNVITKQTWTQASKPWLLILIEKEDWVRVKSVNLDLTDTVFDLL